jgi:hypothetical protein
LDKKIVLEGEFTYGFMGSAGQWYFRLNDEELDPQITNGLEEEGMVSPTEFDEPPYRPRMTAGKIRITIEQVEE